MQNLLSFIDRSLVQAAGLEVDRAFRAFSEQTLADNLIAILMNGIVAAYFWNILRHEWATLTDSENFSEVRRLYRYIWMLYGLLMTVFGAQQILRFLFYIPWRRFGRTGTRGRGQRGCIAGRRDSGLGLFVARHSGLAG